MDKAKFLSDCRELSRSLWLTCTEMPVDMVDDALSTAQDDGYQIWHSCVEYKGFPNYLKIQHSWQELISCATEYLLSSERPGGGIYISDQGPVLQLFPAELLRAFSKFQLELIAYSALINDESNRDPLI